MVTVFDVTKDIPGILYLIKPIQCHNNVYKFGMSSKPNLDRVRKGYLNGTRYLSIMECSDPLYVENIIKSHFNNLYKKPYGDEYYECNHEYDILYNFINIILTHKYSQIDFTDISTSNDTEESTYVPILMTDEI